MNKLYASLAAAAFAMSLGGIAVAQDDAQKKEQEYQAALKKCESLAAAEKQKCIDEAKKKHGQM